MLYTCTTVCTLYSDFGDTNHTAGWVNIHTHCLYTRPAVWSLAFGTKMPVHTADADYSVFQLMTRIFTAT